jgi:hypothetical protein
MAWMKTIAEHVQMYQKLEAVTAAAPRMFTVDARTTRTTHARHAHDTRTHTLFLFCGSWSSRECCDAQRPEALLDRVHPAPLRRVRPHPRGRG